MKLTDIIALAKQGYKPEDIKELMSLAETEAGEGSAGSGDDPQNGESNKQPENSQPETKDPESDTKTGEEQKDPEPDYKALYEKSQEDLKKAQALNVNKSVEKEEEKSIDDQLLDMIEKIL